MQFKAATPEAALEWMESFVEQGCACPMKLGALKVRTQKKSKWQVGHFYFLHEVATESALISGVEKSVRHGHQL